MLHRNKIDTQGRSTLQMRVIGPLPRPQNATKQKPIKCHKYELNVYIDTVIWDRGSQWAKDCF